MDECIIMLSDGYYYQERGGYDWGRVDDASRATVFSSQQECDARMRRDGITGYTVLSQL